jgi:hypothetical protein
MSRSGYGVVQLLIWAMLAVTFVIVPWAMRRTPSGIRARLVLFGVAQTSFFIGVHILTVRANLVTGHLENGPFVASLLLMLAFVAGWLIELLLHVKKP